MTGRGLNSKRLLAIVPSAYILSGLATWLDYLLPGLREIGWDITLGLVSGPRYHTPARYLDEHPFPKTVSIHCGSGTNWDRVSAVRRAIRRVQPDVVMTVNIPHALWAAGLERSECGSEVRTVMTCHGIQQDLYGDMSRFGSALDGVVCTNRLACQLAHEMGGIDERRLYHAAYGVDLPDELSFKRSSDELTIAYVGRLENTQKRVHDIVRIAENLRRREVRFRLLIAGNGPDEPAIKQEVSSAGLKECVTFLGRIPAEELNDRVYQKSHAVLVTSVWETGPIVIWEAMAQGCAVVTSRYIGSGLENALDHEGNCLMFEIGDADVASDHLRKLSEDSELRTRIVTAGRKLIAERYSHEASIDGWNRTLSSILQLPNIPLDAHQLRAIRPQGRMERWLGPSAASRLKRIIGKRPPDTGPAGEWPHTIAGAVADDESFWETAKQMDRQSSERPHSVAPALC